MIVRRYSYKNGDKIIPIEIASNAETILKTIKQALRRRCAPKLRETILSELRKYGWSDRVRLSAKQGLTLTAMHGNIGLCLQMGNMARFYADILKLQSQFLENKISSAIYILPLKAAAKIMGENMAHYERLTSEISSTFSKVITVPILVLGFDQEGDN